MEAVKKDKPWILKFPNYEKYSTEYKKHWDGNILKWEQIIQSSGDYRDDACVMYHTFDSAQELWEVIIVQPDL